ncbi:hypothetical protein CGCS363_v000717 [Colletotrichum siamense]|uniref:uncharacterized protein n=1 Tax=Colletotrichum siamense TaxID=690259 RepID=UPI001872369C|nr:uncharacterized protein CGCS363_v000717 [Colletotrichum siamense]KAF5515153.1 hypothetical protein CGCS363_v000717 [Colletotrichum siamense]
MENDCHPSRHHDRLAFLALTSKIRDWAQVHDHAVPHLLTPEDHRLIRACDRVDPHELALTNWKPGPAVTDRMVRKRYRITIVATGKCVFEVCPKWHRFIKPAVCQWRERARQILPELFEAERPTPKDGVGDGNNVQSTTDKASRNRDNHRRGSDADNMAKCVSSGSCAGAESSRKSLKTSQSEKREQRDASCNADYDYTYAGNAAKQGQRAKNDNGNDGPSVKTRAHVPRKEQSDARPRAKAGVKAARSLTSPQFMTSFEPYRDSTAEGRARKLTMTPVQAKAHVEQCASSTPEHQTTKLSKAAFWAKASRRPSDDMITGGPASRAEFAQMLQTRKKRLKRAKKSGRHEQEKTVQNAKALRKKVAMEFA